MDRQGKTQAPLRRCRRPGFSQGRHPPQDGLSLRASGTGAKVRHQRGRRRSDRKRKGTGVRAAGSAGGKSEKSEEAEGGPSADQWIVKEKPKLRFADVAGLDSVKEDIRLKMVYPFEHPELAQKFGIKGGGGVPIGSGRAQGSGLPVQQAVRAKKAKKPKAVPPPINGSSRKNPSSASPMSPAWIQSRKTSASRWSIPSSIRNWRKSSASKGAAAFRSEAEGHRGQGCRFSRR